MVLLPGTSQVHASAPPAPGFYSGWVFFSAKIDTSYQPSSMLTAWFVEYWQAHGDLMVKINPEGLGGATLVLPVDITLADWGKMTTAQGDCTFSTSAVAQSNYVRLRNPGAPAALEQGFNLPVNVVDGIRYSSNTSSSSGSLKGCENGADANNNAMYTAMKRTTAEIKQINFQVDYQTDRTMGGSCSIPGWEVTTLLKGGQGVRSLETCKWRVFRYNPENQPEGW